MSPSKVMSWWNREDLTYLNQQLHFCGRKVEHMAKQYGTPTFVYSAQRVVNNLVRMSDALNDAGMKNQHRIYYAMKANRFAPLLTYLKQANICGIDACSPTEVEHAVSCGFLAKDISFTATALSEADFEVLARYASDVEPASNIEDPRPKGLFINCDSLHAIHQWGKRKPGSEIGIRINPSMGVGRVSNDKLHYAGSVTTKFGIYKEQFEEALAIARSYDLKVSKIHFHTGCGYLTQQLEQWEAIIEHCLWFVHTAKTVKSVNIGGGLGVPHLPQDGILDIQKWAKLVYKYFGSRGIFVEVEPGDYAVKDAGILLLGKTFLELKRDTLFLGVNAGFNIAPEPAYYDLPFQPVPLFFNEATPSESQLKPVTVVGNINEALDVWYKDALLPDMSNQDYLVLINAGGYSSSMSSNHCMRGQFKEFLLV